MFFNLIGIMFLLGAAGNLDYYNDIGAYCPAGEIIKPLLIACAFFAGGLIWKNVKNSILNSKH